MQGWLFLARDTTFHTEHADFTGRLRFGGEGGRGRFLLRVPSSNLSEWILRAMAPGAVQHFCHRNERSLDFTFPGSDRPQNYGPELLFPLTVTSPDTQKCVTVVNSLLCGISKLLVTGRVQLVVPPLCPSCLRFCCSSVTTSTHSACAGAFPGKYSQRGPHAPVAKAVEVPVWCYWALLS